MIRYVTLGLLLAGAASADDEAQRDKLSGSWRIDASDSKQPSAWTLQRSPYGIHLAGSTGGKTLVEFDCKMAQECQIKDAGHRANPHISHAIGKRPFFMA